MWRLWIRCGTACVLTILAATAADAEAIQVVYKVGVLKQCEFVDSTESCRDFHASFPLTLTFDTQVINEHSEPGRLTRFYGEPTVSDIPLALRNDFPTLGPASRAAAEVARFSVEDGVRVRESGVTSSQVASVGGSDFHRDFSLIANGSFDVRPELDARSFARFLATAPFHQFSIADSIELATGGFELLSYSGRVSLAEPPAVTPEPASLLLVATGLVCLHRRRRGSERQPGLVYTK
jgi:hypothetical protein